jgi:ketosteroid isomerase-like protein
MDVALAWDSALREGDWEAARNLLADEATYTSPEAPEDERSDCMSPDEIIHFFREIKGTVPDAEVLNWTEMGDTVLAHVRLPIPRRSTEWYEVITVRGGLIAQLRAYPSVESAEAAATG